ncbi:DUF4145 domain-containing protein [Aureimonas psammosilenae]|uniref:DUF4145 domain-containing protein n=1 Tax=Aureimonas psammosilenae TaxID=2495496 RepID=UPI001F1B3861|nr:DUF4145 domain-containing protein [Aureimonas psammosilenae]
MSTELYIKRFQELRAQASGVASTRHRPSGDMVFGDSVDTGRFLNWKVKARSLIIKACGESSEHYKQFLKSEEPQSYRTSFEEFQEVFAVFEAAREDFEGGYLADVRNVIQAEVFSDELDQARNLLSAGYKAPSAVIAGVVLETTLRRMCVDRQLSTGKLDKMNSDLAKAGAYNLLVQKRITALADVRNNAAHGHPTQFKDDDVADMINYIESFVATHT